MKTVECEKIIEELKKTLPVSQEISVDFNQIKLSETQQNGYKIIFDKIEYGSGLKRFINKVAMKFTRNSLLQIIAMQNKINLELIKQIDSLNSTIQRLETEVSILKK